MIHAIQSVIVWVCAVALILIASVVILAGMGAEVRRNKRKLRRHVLTIGAFTLVAIVYGGRKGRITVDDPYIRDAGSYLTNDVAHVSIAKRTPILPDETEILVYARHVDLTNATDWVRLEPHLTFADHPYDYALPNATNYDVLVAARYAPAPTVHTNGVWQMKGFTIPGTGKHAFPNTRIRKE